MSSMYTFLGTTSPTVFESNIGVWGEKTHITSYGVHHSTHSSSSSQTLRLAHPSIAQEHRNPGSGVVWGWWHSSSSCQRASRTLTAKPDYPEKATHTYTAVEAQALCPLRLDEESVRRQARENHRQLATLRPITQKTCACSAHLRLEWANKHEKIGRLAPASFSSTCKVLPKKHKRSVQ